MGRAVCVTTERPTPEGSKGFWTKVGEAFDNHDGSLTIRLNALPLSGTLQVRAEDGEGRVNEPGAHEPRQHLSEDAAEELINDMVNCAFDVRDRDHRVPDANEREERARAALMAALTGKAVKT